MSASLRRRNATLLIAGKTVSLYAPGLKVMKRGGSARSDLYWVADEKAVERGYPTKTVRIFVDLDDEAAMQIIQNICAAAQAEMLAWLDDSASLNRPRYRYDGTLRSLIDLYETDPDSSYRDLKANSATSYADSLKIQRETVGARRVDHLHAKDFRRWYKH